MPYKKTQLLTRIDDFQRTNPPCPVCRKNTAVIRSGTRQSQAGEIQLYLCKSCSKKFSDRKLSRTLYPPKTIIIVPFGHTCPKALPKPQV